MKIKTYTALTVAEAMETVRREFGSEAIILSSQHTSEGVRLTVGVEEKISDLAVAEVLYGTHENQLQRRIRQSLEKHRLPSILIERIMTQVNQSSRTDMSDILTEALDKVFHFSPLPPVSNRAFMLVGASGCGKTIAVAKMAVKAKIDGKRVSVITTDIKRAGAIEQLEAFTKILELNLFKIRKPSALKQAIDVVREQSDLILIDTPGINPFLDNEMKFLQDLKKDMDGLEPVLVASAGMDAYETSEMAERFLSLGCSRMLVTRLDLSRHLGSVLFAASNNGLSLCDVGISPKVSEGLCKMSARALAELLLLKNEVVK